MRFHTLTDELINEGLNKLFGNSTIIPLLKNTKNNTDKRHKAKEILNILIEHLPLEMNAKYGDQFSSIGIIYNESTPPLQLNSDWQLQ